MNRLQPTHQPCSKGSAYLCPLYMYAAGFAGLSLAGTCAALSLTALQVLIDAVVHAVNEDYEEMAGDFIKLGFLTAGTAVETRLVQP